MRATFPFPLLAISLACAAALHSAHSEEPAPSEVAFFERKIRPMLVDHCYSCHSAETKALGELRVDDRHGLLAGGKSGPAVVPGDPAASLILERVTHANPKRVMPKEGEPLTEQEVADLTAWIAAGAAWPAERIPRSLGATRSSYIELKEKHWSFQPISAPAVPSVTDSEWPLDDIDRFVLSQLETENLPPVAAADRLTLIRRVTFDLTGLPPTPVEIEAFLSDTSPEAYERVVDRLLASSHYAERWARHWLDVARYGESTGPSRNIPYPHAWKYRDYVIDAVRRDVSYDRFIQEQIAGDLLPAEGDAERDRLLTATGFLALGVKDVNQRFRTRFVMDNVDEQIDTVTRSVLGLTVNCARCHDHKFDPIPMTDYYAIAGIFTSTDDGSGVKNKMGGAGLDYYVPEKLVLQTSEIPEPPADEVAKLKEVVAAAKREWDEIRNTPRGRALDARGRPTQRAYRLRYEKAQSELLALTDPATRGFAVHGVREAEKIGDTEVRLRGEAERLGPVVSRGFLSTFDVPGAPEINREQSGRLELAQWLTHPNNPVTPRVIVNRVWKHLFGEGIVKTVDNFGVNGDTPSHPELLDHLAHRFVSDGWSVKKLVRTLVLTRAYQLGSDAPATHVEADPENRFVWRHSPRRLDAEEIRDAMLASADRLQVSPPEASPARSLRMVELRDNGPDARRIHEEGDRSLSRSLYLPLVRGLTPKTLEAFDPVQQTLVTGRRDTTTVPAQALYLLNSSFVRQQALALAERVAADTARDESDRIQDVYRRILGRPAQEQEVARASGYLGDFVASYQESNQSQGLLVAATSQASAGYQEDTSEAVAVPENPDDIDRTPAAVKEEIVQPGNANEAAWMSLIQALYASAEFRFVR